VRNALSEPCLGGKVFVVVDWVIVPCKASEQSELLLIDCVRSTSERLPDG
jgi:hypothetical protein